MPLNKENKLNHIYQSIYFSLFVIMNSSNPSPRAGCDTRSVFKRSTAGMNSEFSFKTSCLTKALETNQPYYLPIAGGVGEEMDSCLSLLSAPRQLIDSFSYDNNPYTKNASWQ